MARTKQTAVKSVSGKKYKPKDTKTSDTSKIASVKTASVKTSDGDIKKERKKPKFKLTTRARRQVSKAQRSTELLIKRAPFRRLVREIANDFKTDVRFSEKAFGALQEAAETHLVDFFDKSSAIAYQNDRDTLQKRDAHVLGLVNPAFAMHPEKEQRKMLNYVYKGEFEIGEGVPTQEDDVEQVVNEPDDVDSVPVANND